MNDQIPGHQFGNTLVGFAGGCISTIAHTILQIDLTGWAAATGLKIVEVALVGVVGGAMGLIGKKIVESLWPRFVTYLKTKK